jgi:hypothetical protein
MITRLVVSSPRLFTKSGAAVVLISFTAQIFCIVQTIVLVRMFTPVSWVSGFAAIGQAYALMALMPFSIANIGIRDYSFGLFLGAVSSPQVSISAAAVGASTCILVINLFLPALAGLVWQYAAGIFTRKNSPAVVK